MPQEYYAADRELYRSMIESNRARITTAVSVRSRRSYIRNFVAFEETLKNSRVDVAKTYDNSFIDRALAERAK